MGRAEVRAFTGAGVPRLRSAEDGGSGSGRTIEGYAVVFGVESVLLCDWCETYREIIEPGAVRQEDLAGWDVKMLLWHDRERLLARANRGEGTLRLTVDETGLRYEFEAPRTPDGDTALELVRRGDLAGSSFAFWCDERSGVDYERRPDGTLLRHVRRIGEMYDTSIVSDPAYQQTDARAREAGMPEGVAALLREEARRRDARAREAVERIRWEARHRRG